MSKFGLDGGPGVPLPSHFPKSAIAGCKVRGEAGADPRPREPHRHSTFRKGCPLCLACGTSGGSWSHSAHRLRASPPSHSPCLSPTSPGPSFPLCYSYPGLYCSQPTWLLSDTSRAGSASQPGPSGLLAPPGPCRCLPHHLLPASLVKLYMVKWAQTPPQLHPALSSSGGVWREVSLLGSNPQSLDSSGHCHPHVGPVLPPLSSSQQQPNYLPFSPSPPSPSKPRNSVLENMKRRIPCSLQRLALRGEAEKRAMN